MPDVWTHREQSIDVNEDEVGGASRVTNVVRSKQKPSSRARESTLAMQLEITHSIRPTGLGGAKVVVVSP